MEKDVYKLRQAAMIKLRKIECSGFFSTGPQQTNSNLQTSIRSNGGSVPEKSRFSDGKRVSETSLCFVLYKPIKIEPKRFFTQNLHMTLGFQQKKKQFVNPQ